MLIRLIRCTTMVALLALATPLQGLRAATLPDADVANQLAALHAAVDRLEGRVEVLETLVPTFTAFMPDFSERFHVMHAAGDAGDWAVADHELLELRRLLKIAKFVDAQKGELMNAFLTTSINDLKTAIQHGSSSNFRKAVEVAATNCNACHAAAGSAFIKVALDVPQGMSMRHPHVFANSKVLTGHGHGN